jgi:hypothetical protein
MNLAGWQAGLVLGAAFTLITEAIGRALLFKLRHRGHDHCANCDGCLRRSGRALGAIETLIICDFCGDTFPYDSNAAAANGAHVHHVTEITNFRGSGK